MTHQDTIESLEAQLQSLYRERELLNERFGVSSVDDIEAMVSNLEAQLKDFYHRFGNHDGFGDAESALMLSRLKELSSTLDTMYSQKRVQFFFENDKPVLRAEWTEALCQGDAR